nr:tetratricopeptide repeat protein [Candidatus Sigynarchaeota archaeon]
MTSQQDKSRKESFIPKEEDIFFVVIDNEYHVYKVLKVEPLPGGQHVFHLLVYKPVAVKPEPRDIGALEVFAWHVPLASIGDATFLANVPLQPEEFQGYIEYLRLTDFNKYLEFTGKDPDQVVHEAREYYENGIRATDENNFEDAMEWYSKAIETFPLFYEAIDNKAFVLMDLGRWQEAIAVFEQSLGVNENNLAAIFSIGECQFKLEQFDKALVQFQAALEIDPYDQLSREWLEKTRACLHKNLTRT